MPARATAGERDVSRRPRPAGGLSYAQDRASAGSRRSVWPVGRALPPHVRVRVDGGSPAHSRSGISADGQTVRIARLSPGGTTVARRTERQRGALLRPAQYAELRQAPDDLVP